MKEISFELPDVDERGVSPVIGVILMVAITVILAAVIASAVLGFGSNVQENVQAGASVDSEVGDPGSATITWVSEGSADSLEVSVNYDGTETATGTIDNVGGTYTYSEGTGSEIGTTSDDNEVRITVTATSGDSSTVVAQRTVTV
jgi:flagellin-like protein